MAGRREKLRRVGIIPEYRGFTPDGLASGDAIEMTVDELEQDYDARVIAVEHDDETTLPAPDAILHDGDVAIVCVAREDYGRLSRFIRS